MKIKLFLILPITLILLYFAVQTHQYPQLGQNSVISRFAHPFDTRLRYSFGEVDPRFKLSQFELKKIAKDAEYIWQEGLKTSVLVYDPDAKLKINLIYDERQQNSNELRRVSRELQQRQSAHESNLSSLERNESIIGAQKNNIEQRKAELSARYARHRQRIAEWQQSDSSDSSIQQQFEQERAELLRLENQLDREIDDYNQQVRQHDAAVSNLNASAREFNATVNDYRQKFSPKPFHKGVFDGKQINIYEFEDEIDLRMTIAHELGHALGMKHNNDPEALMYPLLADQDMQHFKLKAADIDLYLKR